MKRIMLKKTTACLLVLAVLVGNLTVHGAGAEVRAFERPAVNDDISGETWGEPDSQEAIESPISDVVSVDEAGTHGIAENMPVESGCSETPSFEPTESIPVLESTETIEQTEEPAPTEPEPTDTAYPSESQSEPQAENDAAPSFDGYGGELNPETGDPSGELFEGSVNCLEDAESDHREAYSPDSLADNTETEYQPGESIAVNENAIRTANNTESVTITYDTAGGVWDPDYNPTISVLPGQCVFLPGRYAVSKEGYALRAWRDSYGVEYQPYEGVDVYEDVVFTAIWVEPVTVSFDLAGGEWTYYDHTGQHALGAEFWLPSKSDVRREGYVISGWLDASNEIYSPGQSIEVHEDMLFTAIWVEAVTVSFDLAGGEWIFGDETEQFAPGAYYQLPYKSYVRREGYILSGWLDASNEIYSPGQVIEVHEDMLFTAIWVEPVTVSFDLAGGEWTGGDWTEQVAPGEEYQLPYESRVRREGYIISGWLDASNEMYWPGQWIEVHEDMLFTAIWVEPVTVSYDLAGGEWTDCDYTEQLALGAETWLPFKSDVRREGYVLSGWLDASNEIYSPGQWIEVHEDMLFTAIWVEPVTVSFDLAGGEWTGGDWTKQVTLGAETGLPSRSDVRREGYVLSGWLDASNEIYSPGQWIEVHEDMLFTAIWVEPVTVSFDLAGGEWTDYNYTEQLALGAEFWLPGKGTVRREGYILSGWLDASNEEYSPGQWIDVHEDMLFTAIWVEAVTVSFDLAGGEWTYSDYTEQLALGAEFWLPGRDTVRKEGYVLSGWLDASNEEYSPGEWIDVLEDMLFTAIWVEAVTVSFDLAGGEWTYSDHTGQHAQGAEIWLPDEDRVRREGYFFSGWLDASNEEYSPGQWIEVHEDMLFTAIWVESVTVSFDLAGGEWVYGSKAIDLPKGSEYTIPFRDSIAKEGYVLSVWRDSYGIDHQPYDSIEVHEDILFTAIWVEPVTVSYDLAGGEWTYGDMTKQVAPGQGFTLPWWDRALKEGYVLYGWLDASNVEYSPGQSTDVYEDMLFTAIWGEPVTVSIDLAGGYWWGEVPMTYQLPPGFNYWTPDPYYVARGGYILSGWREETSGVEYPLYSNFVVNEDTVLTAIWVAYPLEIMYFQPADNSVYVQGDTIELEADAFGGEAFEYEFYGIRSNGNTFTIRSYDEANSFSWKPYTPDTYTVGVRVRNSEGEVVTEERTIVLEGPVNPCSIAVFRAGTKSEYTAGETIALAARGEGGTAPYQYQFYVVRSNGARVILRDYALGNTYNWTPRTPDTYQVGVNVEDAAGQTVNQEKTVTVNQPLVETLEVAVFRAGTKSEYTAGETIALAARGEGGTAPYQYQFYVVRSNGARVILRDYALGNTYNWTPRTPDTYQVGVNVEDAAGQTVNQEKTVTVNQPLVETLEVAVFRAGTKSEYTAGETIALAARGEGGTAPYQYQFYVIRSNEARVILRDYALGNTYNWTPRTPDTYQVGVNIKDAAGQTVNQEKTVTVNPLVETLEVAVFRTGTKSEYTAGETVAMAARGEGGTAPYQYQFYVIRSNGARVILRDYALSNTFNWTPRTPDTYLAGVNIKDAAGQTVNQEKTVTVNPLVETLEVAVFRAGTKPEYTTGETIALAARGEGGSAPYQYQFYVVHSNGARVILRDYAPGNTFSWIPTTSDAYQVCVAIKDASGTVVTSAVNISVK